MTLSISQQCKIIKLKLSIPIQFSFTFDISHDLKYFLRSCNSSWLSFRGETKDDTSLGKRSLKGTGGRYKSKNTTHRSNILKHYSRKAWFLQGLTALVFSGWLNWLNGQWWTTDSFFHLLILICNLIQSGSQLQNWAKIT